MYKQRVEDFYDDIKKTEAKMKDFIRINRREIELERTT